MEKKINREFKILLQNDPQISLAFAIGINTARLEKIDISREVKDFLEMQNEEYKTMILGKSLIKRKHV